MSFLFHFWQNNAVGGENKNLQRDFYFELDFQKNRVGSPENQKMKKISPKDCILARQTCTCRS